MPGEAASLVRLRSIRAAMATYRDVVDELEQANWNGDLADARHVPRPFKPNRRVSSRGNPKALPRQDRAGHGSILAFFRCPAAVPKGNPRCCTRCIQARMHRPKRAFHRTRHDEID